MDDCPKRAKEFLGLDGRVLNENHCKKHGLIFDEQTVL